MFKTRLLAAAVLLASISTAHATEYTTVDTTASRITFSYSQMGVDMDGHFGKFSSQLAFDPAKPESARAVLELQLASIDAGSSEANDEVKTKTWFNVPAFPVARFESSSVKALGNNRFELAGKLSIKGKTRDITAPVTFTAQGTQGLFDGSFVLKRGEFAIGEGEWADFSIVANDIQVKFHIVANAAK